MSAGKIRPDSVTYLGSYQICPSIPLTIMNLLISRDQLCDSSNYSTPRNSFVRGSL